MILASQEKIRKWTEAGAWGNKTLIDYFNLHVRKQPDKVCLVDPLNKEALVGLKPERLTYKELDRAVDADGRGPDRQRNPERRHHHGAASQHLGTGDALSGDHPDRARDLPDADAVALFGTELHRGHDRCGGAHHRGGVRRLQPRGDGPEDPGEARVRQAAPHPPEIRENVQGRSHRQTGRDPDRSQRYLHPLLVLRHGGGAQGMPAQPQQLAVPVPPSASSPPRSTRATTSSPPGPSSTWPPSGPSSSSGSRGAASSSSTTPSTARPSSSR